MRRRKIIFAHLSRINLLIKKFAIVFIFIASFILILLNKTESIFIEKTTSATTDIFSPILDLTTLPARLIVIGYEKIIDIKNNTSINTKLQQESKELAILKNKYIALKIENNILSDMLNYKQSPEEQYITARVVAEEQTPFSQSLIAYVGNNSKVKKDQIVLSQEGVIGRVEKVSGFYAKILLATDINSRIPIMIQKNSSKAILSGDNTKTPKIEFLATNSNISIGDRVITSGVGGIFPSGLVVGTISSTNKHNIRVKLTTDLDSLEYVKIVSYEE